MIFFLLLLSTDFPYQQVRFFDDGQSSPQGLFLTSPMDALLFKDKLYVVDKSQSVVFIQEPDGTISTFGRDGEGPGEFQNTPLFLSLHGDTIGITEFNYLRISYFTPDGVFLHREARAKRPVEAMGFEKLNHESIFETGLALKDKRHDCLMSRVEDSSEEGLHLARFYLREDAEGLVYVISRSGKITLFERPCREIASMPLPLGRYKADVKPNPIVTKLNRMKYPGSRSKAFFHGLPITDVAVKDKRTVWLLVKDETLEQPPYYQPVSDVPNQIYEVDPVNQKVTFAMKCPFPVSGIRYQEGNLILWSGYESSVTVFAVD